MRAPPGRHAGPARGHRAPLKVDFHDNCCAAAGGLLLAGAIGGLGMMRRRKAKKAA
jgi:hypothetical protein